MISGSDYTSWRKRFWDGQYGGAGSKLMGVARGYGYWLTAVGDIVRSADGSQPEVLTRKAVRPSARETAHNPRAASARLRAAEKA